GAVAALGAALCWAVSPVFVREGLKTVDRPLVGVAVGMALSAALFAVFAPTRWGRGARPGRIPARILGLELAAGSVLALANWARWEALARAPVGIVLALVLLSVPTVMVLAPRLAGRHGEQVSA